MPAPISVSPRGGPQPARRQSIARNMGPAQVIGGGSQVPEYFGDGSLTDAIVRATANVARRAGQPSRRPPAPLSLDTPTRGEVAPEWDRPTADELQAFVAGLQQQRSRDNLQDDLLTTLLPFGTTSGPGSSPSDNVVGNPIATQALLAGSLTPEALASGLGLEVPDIQPLLDTAAQRAALESQVDTQVTQANNRATTPTRPGGQTPDSIDRAAADGEAVDPLTYATEVPLGSADLEAMILALQNRRLDEAPARLAEAKRLIMERTASDIARANELGAAYRAGLGQSSIQRPLPGAGESTAQSQYTTAAPVRAAASPLNGFLPGIDTVAAEDEILQTAYLIEQDRKTAAEEAMLASLEEQFKVRAAEEGELESIVKSEEKKATREQIKIEQQNREAADTRVWAQQRAADVAAALDRRGVAGNADGETFVEFQGKGSKALRDLVARFRAGDSTESAVRAVFGSEVRTSMLSVPALNMIQIAKVLAGGNVPDELRGVGAGKNGLTLDEFLAAAAEAG